MKTTTLPLNSMNRPRVRAFVLIPLLLACFALSPTVRAVDPPPDGAYPNGNTAEADGALFSLTTSADNTAMEFDVLDSNTTCSGNAPASRNWTVTGRLHTGRDFHTATLLQNSMVLVAGGTDSNIQL